MIILPYTVVRQAHQERGRREWVAVGANDYSPPIPTRAWFDRLTISGMQVLP